MKENEARPRENPAGIKKQIRFIAMLVVGIAFGALANWFSSSVPQTAPDNGSLLGRFLAFLTALVDSAIHSVVAEVFVVLLLIVTLIVLHRQGRQPKK